MMTILLFMSQFTSLLSVSAVLLFVLVRLASGLRRRPGGVEDGRGRAVLVTGCDSGFGQQLALRLDRRGFLVFAGCLSPGGPGARGLALQGSGNLKVLQLDVTKDEDVEQAKRVVQKNLPEKGEFTGL